MNTKTSDISIISSFVELLLHKTVSVFSHCFSYFWGWLSDKKGRRPIILLCVSLIGLTTLSFGFTTNIYFAVITRMLAGLVNGKWLQWLKYVAGCQEMNNSH